jgi:hypothetical protein
MNAVKSKYLNLVWGIILIAAGGLFLAQNLGYLQELSLLTWVVVFGGLCLLFLASYLINGVRQWGWLFPTLLSGALALTVGLVSAGVESSAIGAPILIAVGIPFLIAFLLNRQTNWWALIPAWTMLVLTAVVLLVDWIPSIWVGSLVLFGIALPFLVVFLVNRSRWWALIPAWVMALMGVITLLADRVLDEALGTIVLWGIALPFLVVFLLDRSRRWALIPAGVLGVVGIIPLLTVATPLRNWWPVLPILAGVGLLVWGLLQRRRPGQ